MMHVTTIDSLPMIFAATIFFPLASQSYFFPNFNFS